MVKYYGRARTRTGSVNTNQLGLKMSGCPSTVGKQGRIARYMGRRVDCMMGLCKPIRYHEVIWPRTRMRNQPPFCKAHATKCLAAAGGVGTNHNIPYYRIPKRGESGCTRVPKRGESGCAVAATEEFPRDFTITLGLNYDLNWINYLSPQAAQAFGSAPVGTMCPFHEGMLLIQPMGDEAGEPSGIQMVVRPGLTPFVEGAAMVAYLNNVQVSTTTLTSTNFDCVLVNPGFGPYCSFIFCGAGGSAGPPPFSDCDTWTSPLSAGDTIRIKLL